jgi:hypothetical protein
MTTKNKAQNTLKQISKGEGGFILPAVLALFGLGVLLIAPALGNSFTGLQANTVTETKADELHAADAGIEDAIHWLMQGADGDTRYTSTGEDQWQRVASIPMNDTTIDVAIEEIGPYHRIQSTATSATGDTTAEAFVLITMDEGIASEPSPFDYSVVTLDGDLVVLGSSGIDSLPPAVPGDPSTYGASVWVNGNINLGWSTNIWGDAKVTGTADRPTNIKGTYTPGADPPARPVWLDERIETYIAQTEVSVPECSGIACSGTVYTGNRTLGWGMHGTYDGLQVTGNLTISGTSGGGLYTFTGPVCVGGTLTISSTTHVTFQGPVKLGGNLVVQNGGTVLFQDLVCVDGYLKVSSGENHVVFQEPVKVDGYLLLEGNGTVIFEDVVYVAGYLKVGGSRSCKFMDQVAIEGNLKTSNCIVDIGGSKYSGADYDVVFESTIRATEPNAGVCYDVRFGSGRAYTFNGPVYTTEKAKLAGNAGCEMTFTNGLIADCDIEVSGSSRTNAPPESSPLLVSRYGGVSLMGNVPVDAIVYCPEGRGYMSGSSVLHGAMVARNANLEGNVRLKYPVLLAERGDLHEGGGGEGTGAAGITLVSYSVS